MMTQGRTSCTSIVVRTVHARPPAPARTSAVAILNAFAAMRAELAFMRASADIISPALGVSISSRSDVTTGSAEDAVGAAVACGRRALEWALRVGGATEPLRDTRAAPPRLRSIRSGMASARLVPTNCRATRQRWGHEAVELQLRRIWASIAALLSAFGSLVGRKWRNLRLAAT